MSMTRAAPRGYRTSQISLHWLVFFAVLFLFVTGDNMSDAFDEMLKLGAKSIWIPVHIGFGLLVLAAMIARLALRRRYGVPVPPPDQPAALRLAASGVHGLLYALLIVAPLIGLIAFFFVPKLGVVHALLVRLPLMLLVGLHVAGALWHHFLKGDSVLKRMVQPVSN